MNNNNTEIVKQLQSNATAINQINSNLSKMSSLKLAEFIEDQTLLNYHEQIRINYKNIFDLKCISYKLQAHIAAGFIPRFDRVRGHIPSFRINNISRENFEFIKNILNGFANISKIIKLININ